MDNAQPKRAKDNLLVVDDDLSARQTMEAFLTREGYEVRCAPNGQMALIKSVNYNFSTTFDSLIDRHSHTGDGTNQGQLTSAVITPERQ